MREAGTVDRSQLADFLKKRREALQPEDVGLPRGPRRRTGGLRREEVAALSGMSTDYYSRLEQQRGTHPSEPMLAAIARGLRLSLDERDHLFRLAGQNAPSRALRSDHVSPGLMRILDRLADTPAQVMSALGETLVQTRPAVALFGDETRYTGLARTAAYRWFTDPDARNRYPETDRPLQGRIITAQLRATNASAGGGRAQELVDTLLAASAEFAELWREHEVGLRYTEVKRIQHPEVGLLELHCQLLLDPDNAHALMVFTAVPGSESYDRLALLSVIGDQQLNGPR
jgi:transcriptional regulator with XRE-family HTH domain